MDDSNLKLYALESENKSLKEVIEKLDAQCKALDQTLTEVLRSNIQLKAGCSLLENKISELKKDFETKLEKNSNEAPPHCPL